MHYARIDGILVGHQLWKQQLQANGIHSAVMFSVVFALTISGSLAERHRTSVETHAEDDRRGEVQAEHEGAERAAGRPDT